MSDSGSPRDAFARRKPPAKKGLGAKPDMFRKGDTALADPFAAKAKPAMSKPSAGDAFAPKPKQDAFAHKAKPAKTAPPLMGKRDQRSALAKKEALPGAKKQAAVKTDAFGKVKPPRPAKPVKNKPAAFSAPMAMKRAPANAPRLPAPPAKPKLDLFGRPVQLAQAKAPPAMLMGKPAKPAPAMTRPTGAIYNPFARKPATPPPVKAAEPPPASQPAPVMAEPPPAEPPPAIIEAPIQAPPVETPQAPEPPQAAEAVKADALRAPLQLVANDTGEDAAAARPAMKMLRRAPRPTSLVLVSGMGSEAVAETFDDGVFTMSAGGDPDDLVADKPPGAPASAAGSPPVPPPQAPPAPSAEPAPPPVEAAAKPPEPPPPEPPPPEAAPPPVAAAEAPVAPAPVEPAPVEPASVAAPEPVAAKVEAAVEPPPAAPVPPEPAPEPIPEAAPVAAAAAAAAAATAAAATAAPAPDGVETVEATVEPPLSTRPAPEAIPEAATLTSATASVPPEAVETAWQPVEGDTGAPARPAVGVLEKVVEPVAGGFWGGATIGSTTSAKAATRRRGFFNQDDMFGLMFGLAVLAFLVLWLFRGKSIETPDGDELVTAQAAATAAAPVTPLLSPPSPDPFGNKPVDLRPTGPVPSSPTGEAATPPAAATPAPPPAASAAPPPAAAVAPPAAAPATSEHALPLAGRKMHAWFCTASSRLTQPSRTALQDELEKFAGVFNGQELIVRGYADTRGSSASNVNLGERRANSVAKLLRGKGLSVVDVEGVGELDGLDDNKDCSNQRRVDVWVKNGPAETPSRECAPEPDAASLVCQ